MNGINHHLKYTHSGLSKCEFDSRKWVLGMLYGPQHTQIHTKYMDESGGRGRKWWRGGPQVHIAKYMDILKEKKE